MPSIEDRLASIEEKVSQDQTAELKEQLAQVLEMLKEMKGSSPTKEYYGVDEIAELVGRSTFQVREWCREGRIKAEKRGTGRGRHKEWMVAHAELDRYRSFGLNPRS